jgi:hypothetical protein
VFAQISEFPVGYIQYSRAVCTVWNSGPCCATLPAIGSPLRRTDIMERSPSNAIVLRKPGNLSATAMIATGLLLASIAAFAQDAVPRGILQRTVPIYPDLKSSGGGTAFSVDYAGKIYLVTARHVVNGLPQCNAKVHLWLGGKWEDSIAPRVLYPTSGADVAVFETGWTASRPFPIAMMRNGDGITFGQQVWFLGYPLWTKEYPHGMSSQFGKAAPPLAFIKRATLSAVDASNPRLAVMYLDGFNNKGFSGGPIVYWDFKSRAYKIAGVVTGYEAEEIPQKLKINGQELESHLLENSGIIIAYGIANVVDAIRASQTSNPCMKH